MFDLTSLTGTCSLSQFNWDILLQGPVSLCFSAPPKQVFLPDNILLVHHPWWWWLIVEIQTRQTTTSPTFHQCWHVWLCETDQVTPDERVKVTLWVTVEFPISWFCQLKLKRFSSSTSLRYFVLLMWHNVRPACCCCSEWTIVHLWMLSVFMFMSAVIQWSLVCSCYSPSCIHGVSFPLSLRPEICQRVREAGHMTRTQWTCR